MPNLSTAQITGIISIALILSGAVVVGVLEKSYYCPTEDNVKECIRLSDSGITCYYLTADDLTKGDRCTGGTWQPVDIILKDKNFITSDVKVTGFDIKTDCIRDGEWCYCNPRGLIKNKVPC